MCGIQNIFPCSSLVETSHKLEWCSWGWARIHITTHCHGQATAAVPKSKLRYMYLQHLTYRDMIQILVLAYMDLSQCSFSYSNLVRDLHMKKLSWVTFTTQPPGWYLNGLLYITLTLALDSYHNTCHWRPTFWLIFVVVVVVARKVII